MRFTEEKQAVKLLQVVCPFSPYKQLYYVGAEAHYTVNDKLTIKAGIIRDCYHPVNAWGKTDGKVDGASLKIYVTASGKIPIW